MRSVPKFLSWFLEVEAASLRLRSWLETEEATLRLVSRSEARGAVLRLVTWSEARCAIVRLFARSDAEGAILSSGSWWLEADVAGLQVVRWLEEQVHLLWLSYVVVRSRGCVAWVCCLVRRQRCNSHLKIC